MNTSSVEVAASAVVGTGRVVTSIGRAASLLASALASTLVVALFAAGRFAATAPYCAANPCHGDASAIVKAQQAMAEAGIYWVGSFLYLFVMVEWVVLIIALAGLGVWLHRRSQVAHRKPLGFIELLPISLLAMVLVGTVMLWDVVVWVSAVTD